MYKLVARVQKGSQETTEMESEKAESESLLEEETTRLLNDSASQACEIKRFDDLRASDKERHN